MPQAGDRRGERAGGRDRRHHAARDGYSHRVRKRALRLRVCPRGIVPEACSTWFLPRIVGISQALEWCYSGRVFSAQEALAGKLVSEIVAPDQLIPTARAMAREIIDNTAPVSIALIRQMTWRMLGADHPMEAHRLDSRGMYARGLSEDMREGVLGFLQKRAAKFPGKVSTGMPSFFPWWKARKYD